jgi:hypothetical protein
MWRQVDTIGVAVRYAHRWMFEPNGPPFWAPAVINSGDTQGIMAMEFPLLNVLGAGGVYLGERLFGSYLWGLRLAQLIHWSFVIGLVVLAYLIWKKQDGGRWRWMPFMAVLMSYGAPFTAKFMPDLPAMLFVVVGVGLILRHQFFVAALPIALGLLMKPTSCIVLVLVALPVFLLQSPWKTIFEPKKIFAVASALIPAGLWYTVVVEKLHSMQESESLFAIANDPHPIDRLHNFFTKMSILESWDFHGYFQGASAVVIIGSILFWSSVGPWRHLLGLFAIVFIQSLVIGALSGHHSDIHSYYLIGLSTTFSCILILLWRHDYGSKERYAQMWRMVIALGITARTLEYMQHDMSGAYTANQGYSHFVDCAELKAKAGSEIPFHQNVVFRTPKTEYPLTELCFGERGGSQSNPWGLFPKFIAAPEGCKTLSEGQKYKIVHCHQKS